MNKTVLFVPGFKESRDSRDYQSVISAIESKGYVVRFVSISWDRTTIYSWVEQLESVYSDHDPEQTILAGFSFGAMTALSTAVKRNPYQLWLFSLSPYYAEDISTLAKYNEELATVGKRRMQAFENLNFQPIVDRINCKSLVLVGEDEYTETKERCKLAAKQLKGSRLVKVANTAHDVSDKQYIEQIVRYI